MVRGEKDWKGPFTESASSAPPRRFCMRGWWEGAPCVARAPSSPNARVVLPLREAPEMPTTRGGTHVHSLVDDDVEDEDEGSVVGSIGDGEVHAVVKIKFYEGRRR